MQRQFENTRRYCIILKNDTCNALKCVYETIQLRVVDNLFYVDKPCVVLIIHAPQYTQYT